MVVLILMGRIIWKAVTFILNLLHPIREEWWTQGSAHSHEPAAPFTNIHCSNTTAMSLCCFRRCITTFHLFRGKLKMNDICHMLYYLSIKPNSARHDFAHYCKAAGSSGFIVSGL